MKEIIKNLYIFENKIDVELIFKITNEIAICNNCGASLLFNGIVRNENKIEGLKFKIYEPLLIEWFKNWINKEKEAILIFAHSKGVVKIGESSFISCVMSKHRKIAHKIFYMFVEDFKKNAPIWKFDIQNGKTIFNDKNSHKLPFSGLMN